MKQFTIVAVVVMACVAGLASATLLKDISVSLGGGFNARTVVFDEIEDTTTFRKLGEKTLTAWHTFPDMEDIRMVGHRDRHYNLDETLKDAGITDNATIKLKAWPKLMDALMAVGGRLGAQELINKMPEK